MKSNKDNPVIKIILGLVLVMLLLFFVVNFMGNNNQKNTTSNNNEIVITMENTTYNPNDLEIEAGTTVIWENNDNITHTVSSNNNQQLNSGDLEQGDSYQYTFENTGTYNYYCQYHSSMQGQIVVVGEGETGEIDQQEEEKDTNTSVY